MSILSPALVRIAAPVALALSLALAAGTALAEPAPLKDARRIVAIGGAVTEIVHALGEEGRLVARDTTSSYPPAADALPDVGYMRALSPEGVLSVKPDAILAIEGSGPPEALTVLKGAGVDFVTVPERFDAAGISEKVRLVSAALGVPEKGAELVRRIEAELQAATAEAAARGRDARVLFILSLSGGRILAAGDETAAAGVIRLAGARNAIEGLSGYKQISDEAAMAAAPDVILMISRSGDHQTGEAEVLAHPGIARTPAGVHRRLIRMDGLYLLGFGPRTAAAVGDLSAALTDYGL
ncbi:ABC transporter substrate-binding protein [Stappia taiwanensis]|uniref:ABC transporter substrate-binding protein n=1 Tax=Stappia taiwanensis TaxID=992267 RepID=A0A838Y2D0_9HYPH|nr:ABC transporter substrate-binding protein [Stappia taiwanensis]MBA4613080.1 ABC transporter substrate-binding protein [Stappia taiwanensis]GGF01395.1 hemin ABC transporter substrate-binding protein [Stappia taiwanensis]